MDINAINAKKSMYLTLLSMPRPMMRDSDIDTMYSLSQDKDIQDFLEAARRAS